ncbi:2-deoxy-D-gluconate 3-dehydrogenase [Pullulanibacillus pueri]|uniref:2-deoxy-D-gluconate 3-dehydrogenase n=2 Tax=Pullulanibacillus pueri TaxID=1437324 RepID=A0A8J2ZSB7_9BACL|nr:2-deoxy-D-gluconate 3-dehydrogenase [Pullulanibacillus pueri]
MALALAEAGANVAITSRNKERAEAGASFIAEATGQPTLGVMVDVTQADDVESMVRTVVEHFGSIDILVNNAGVNIRKEIEAFDEESWDLVQNTNLKAPFLCARAVAKYMRRQKHGRVINIASMLGSVALPGRGAYSSSKGGLLQLTKVLALEWAPDNVTVNALSPGPMATELNKVVMEDPETNHYFIDNIALGRWGDPEELAGAIVFLASDASSFMTGADLVIDGGWSAR